MEFKSATDLIDAGVNIHFNFFMINTKHEFLNRFRKWLPLVYFDSRDGCKWVGNSVLVDHHVRMRYDTELSHPNYKYYVIFAKVHKDDFEKFVECMEVINKKHLLIGNTDYPKFCKEIVLKMCGRELTIN